MRLKSFNDFCPWVIIIVLEQIWSPDLRSYYFHALNSLESFRTWAAPGSHQSFFFMFLWPSVSFSRLTCVWSFDSFHSALRGVWTLCFFETSPAGSVSYMAPVEMIFCHIAIESQVAEVNEPTTSTKGYAQNCQQYLCRHCAPRYTWMAVNCQLLWQNDWRNQSAKYE